MVRRAVGRVLAALGIRAAKKYARDNQKTFSDLGWHERMLADRVRVEAYRAAMPGIVPPGSTVVDLGTGTGILAMLAAKAGAGRVVAIDHSKVIDLASAIARQNGINNIDFKRMHSSELSLPSRADLIIHEQMGHEIFGEHMVENLLDLKRRLLNQRGRIEPGRFRLMAAPVSLAEQYRRPFIWEIRDSEIDYSFLKSHPITKEFIGDRHGRRLIKNFEVDALLAPPQNIVEFDMNEISGQGDIVPRSRIEWEIDRSGQVDGILFYFHTWFGDGTTFDTAPSSVQTNWDCPMLRIEERRLEAGQRLSCDLSLAPLTDWWSWKVSSLETR